MRAELIPLDGKYYGTEIRLDFEDGGKEEFIILWESGDNNLSEREIEQNGFTKEQYHNNELVDDGHGKKIRIQLLLQPDDIHFESEKTYRRALQIIEKLNSN